MATIKEFNKNNLKALRQDMNAALAKLEAQYGIQINVGNASYSDNEVTFKTKCNTISASGTVITKEAQNWSLYAELNGVGQFSIGDRITLQGKVFEIAGWNTRAKKSPVMIKEVGTGKGYKCPKEVLMGKLPMTK
jgi:hypothetical protein